jgi:hypothetical protein
MLGNENSYFLEKVTAGNALMWRSGCVRKEEVIRRTAKRKVMMQALDICSADK